MKNSGILRRILLQFVTTAYLFFGILFQIVGGRISYNLVDTISSKNPNAKPLFLTYSKISRHYAPNLLTGLSDEESVSRYPDFIVPLTESIQILENASVLFTAFNTPSNKSPPNKSLYLHT